MARKRNDDDEQEVKRLMTVEEISESIEDRVAAFCQQYISLPRLMMPCEVMDIGQLRDAMGLRASIDWGDPWPSAEKQLHDLGFRWQSLSGMRVMYLKERDEYKPDTGWEEAEEYID